MGTGEHANGDPVMRGLPGGDPVARDPGSKDPVYLDYAATTPVDPAVAEAMVACLTMEGDFGNAGSATHVFGRRAAARVETARVQVAALIGAEPDEITFTSGATESSNLVLFGVARANADRGRHIITSRTEHKAVLDPCRRLEKDGFAITYLTPDRQGRIHPDAVLAAFRPDTVLVSIMYVNNETGVMQDIDALATLCRDRGVAFHTDAAQAAGKVPLDVGALPVDFVSFTAHKIYGPKGIGALYARRKSRPLVQPLIFGGGQERGLRPGTLPTHQIVGFGRACEIARERLSTEPGRLASLRDRLWEGLARLGGVHLNGEGAPRAPAFLNVSFEGVEGESLVTGLVGLAVSTGSACNSASGDASYVLRALGRDTQLAQSSLRFSVGRFTTVADIDVALAEVRREIERLRALSPASEPDVSAAAVDGRAATEAGKAADTTGVNPARSPKPRVAGRQASPQGLIPLDAPSEAQGESETGTVLTGEAGGPGQEAWVRFHVTIEKGIVKAARFKAYGCPHTLQVASWLSRQLLGRSRQDGAPGTPSDWAATLAVPVEKLGRLLVIEDALNACLGRWPRGA